MYGTKCGYFSNVENCRPSTACVVDMYIDDKANLPWNTNSRFEVFTEENLILSLWHKRKKTAYIWKRITKRGQQYKLGLDATTVVHGKNDKSRMGGYFILEYDRESTKT
ncbi:hypothetical protein BSPWISOXPB_6328 [uncultured Gammaproteobacteria bacterium]|nr:hypothetical protein BSPWISOXPB_6328 [uncultured Gammaproteobacteria bacterium]